ncbi:MAG: hypothetical protein ABIW76_12010 [Fibrobacteria bacterium]
MGGADFPEGWDAADCAEGAEGAEDTEDAAKGAMAAKAAAADGRYFIKCFTNSLLAKAPDWGPRDRSGQGPRCYGVR